jgi:hypothetical protein
VSPSTRCSLRPDRLGSPACRRVAGTNLAHLNWSPPALIAGMRAARPERAAAWYLGQRRRLAGMTGNLAMHTVMTTPAGSQAHPAARRGTDMNHWIASFASRGSGVRIPSAPLKTAGQGLFPKTTPRCSRSFDRGLTVALAVLRWHAPTLAGSARQANLSDDADQLNAACRLGSQRQQTPGHAKPHPATSWQLDGIPGDIQPLPATDRSRLKLRAAL